MKLLFATSDTGKYYKVFVIVNKPNVAYFLNEDFDYNLYWYTSVSYDLLSVTSVLFCVSRFVSIILSVRLGVTCFYRKATYWYVSRNSLKVDTGSRL